MLPRRKGKFMGVHITMMSRIKPEYRFGSEMKDMIFIEVRKHKKYGARAELYVSVGVEQMMWKDVSNKKRKRMQRRLNKRFNKIKDETSTKVNTNKWVKPDKESLINELVKNLFLLEILNDNEYEWHIAKGKSDVIYGILNSKSPKNPQSLDSFGISEYFSIILNVMKVPECKKNMQITFPNYGKGPKSGWYKEMRETEEGRRMYQDWKKKCLANMIVKGNLYHHILAKEK